MAYGAILLVDNIVKYADTRAEILRRNGFEVYCAYSPGHARQVLREKWIHLAILDIRLTNDDDDDDRSGLELAEDPEFSHIPKMILTGFPTVENVREALTPDQRRNSNILRFRSKKENVDEILKDVREIFDSYVNISRDLKIHWRNPSAASLVGIVGLLRPASSADEIAALMRELEDLLRITFHACNQITITRSIWHQEGRMALDATSFAGNEISQLILDIRNITHKKDLLRPVMETSRLSLPKVLHQTRSIHFEITAWKLEFSLSDFSPFSSFVLENTDKRIASALESLYQTALAPWYGTGLQVDELNLSTLYQELIGMTGGSGLLANLETKIQHLLKACVASRLIVGFKLDEDRLSLQFFSNGNRSDFPNPVRVISRITGGSQIVRRVLSTGAVCMDALLVDRMTRIAVTDFSPPVMLPCEVDFINMELDARVFGIGPANLPEILEMERELSSLDELTATFPLTNVHADCRKQAAMVFVVRRLASQIFQSDMRDYLTGLFYLALQRFNALDKDLQYAPADLVYFLHHLLICCQTLDNLQRHGSTPGPDEGPAGISIDDANHEVLVNGRVVNLTPTEYDLLLYLYNRQGSLCRRQDIMREVFKIDDPDPDSEKSLLNTHMGRLRTKIEFDAGNPRYIVTVRGQGYKLVKDPV